MSDTMETKPDQPGHTEEVYNSPKRRGIIDKLYPPGPQPGVKGRMKNHCRKFWWCDFLVFACVFLIIFLPIIYVAIPNIAQDEINKSTLEVVSQDVSNPQPDSIHLNLKSVIRSNSSFHPRLDGFRAALTLDGKNTPFLYIDIPSVKSNKEVQVTVDQDIKLPNLDAFTDYTKTVMSSETFKVRLTGKTKLHLGGLPTYDIDYNKVVTMKGLNHLSGMNITELKILAGMTILPDGSNMVGKVMIPNPSVQTLQLGNTTMNLSVDGKSIGTTLLPNLTLTPGNNTYDMQSNVNQLNVLGLVQNQYKNAILPLSIVGNSTIDSKGQHLTYYEAAIQNNVVNVSLNIGPALSAIGINTTSST